MHIFNLSALYLIEGEALPMLPAALFHTWSWPVLPLVSLVLGTGIYLRGWAVARSPPLLTPWTTIFLLHT
jgi:hypothetical protein